MKITVPALLSDSEYELEVTSPCVRKRKRQTRTIDLKVCDCRKNHASYTTTIPYNSYKPILLDSVKKITRTDPKLGVFTDLQGYEIDYDDLSGLWWHNDFYHGVKLGDRQAALLRIRQSLPTSIRSSSPILQSDPVTPPPKKVKVEERRETQPWTAHSTSGKITSLQRRGKSILSSDTDSMRLFFSE